MKTLPILGILNSILKMELIKDLIMGLKPKNLFRQRRDQKIYWRELLGEEFTPLTLSSKESYTYPPPLLEEVVFVSYRMP